jgi:hypothetical protein
MKKLLKSLSYLFAFAIIFSSCSKNTDTATAKTTSLTLSVDKTTISADGFDISTISVKDQTGAEVNATCLIISNGIVYGGNKFVVEYGSHGSYEVYATKDNVTSNKVIITVTNPGPSKYSTKVLVEDCTGAWCGWCPRLAYKFDNFMANNSRIFMVGVHNGDSYALSSVESSLRAKFGVNSFPSGIVNRSRTFNDNGNISSLADSTDLGSYLRTRMISGLAINTTISGNTLNVTTKVGFDGNVSQSLKLVVMLVQDNIVLSQVNYYNGNNSYPGNPYYNSGSTITNFVHKNVLRSTPTGILGADITGASQIKGGEYTASHAIDVTGLPTVNLKVVAAVVFADGQSKSGILNTQWVTAGQNKAYD